MADCLGPFSSISNEVETEVIDLVITKETCPYHLKGRDICYGIVITNNSDINLTNLLFHDELDETVEYVPHSFEVDDIPQTPMMANNTIQYPISVSANGGEVKIKFCVSIKSND
ncbi:MAG: hypothetical protein FWE22_05325 [Firmicutes bacterium]|nr:hypothetical protein [Bacillota bacterium]